MGLLVTFVTLSFVGCIKTSKHLQDSGIAATEKREKEKIYFMSRNISGGYDNILDGLDNDPEVKVYGYLRIPEGTEGKIPAVVFIHGSGGQSPKHLVWIYALKSMGIATFQLDSFTPRGQDETVGSKQTTVSSGSMITDAYLALKLLSEHPGIDKNKIGIMGGSKGGIVALNAAWKPIRDEIFKDDDLKFAFHIPVYPLCMEFENLDFTGSPILIMIGEKDDWTPVEPCNRLYNELLSAGVDIQIKIYPEAYHSFDADYSVQTIQRGYKWGGCQFRVLKDGRWTINGMPCDTEEDTRKAMKKCVKCCPHAGGNEKAKRAALKDFKEFITNEVL